MSEPLRPSRCPSPECTSRAPRTTSKEPAILLHSLLRTRQGTRRRFRCRHCGKTFTARNETAYHRLRSSPERFERAVHMLIEGASKAAVARTARVSPSTITRWQERAAKHSQRVFDKVARDLQVEELQADEVRGYAHHKTNRQFVFTMVETGARFWLSATVGPRTLRNTRILARDSRSRCAFGQERVLIVTDPFKYYGQEFKRAWGPTCVHVESSKIIRGGRVVRVRNTLVHGAPWHLEAARERCTASRKINTAFVERLNLFIRRSLACMQRKTNAAARTGQKLREAIELLRCYYNFVRPHGSLKYGGICRTPAEIAGLVTRRLCWRDVFMAFSPTATVPWIKDEAVRKKWREQWSCPGNNS